MHAEQHEDTRQPARPDEPRDEEPRPPASEPEMVAWMRRYHSLKKAREQQKDRTREYLDQVKAEIDADMRPIEEEIEHARLSMLAFISEVNAGRKFRVPGLGTAFTQHRISVKIEDEQAFAASLDDAERAEVFEIKLNPSRAKALVQGSYEGDGEVRPGCEVEKKQTLAVKLSG